MRLSLLVCLVSLGCGLAASPAHAVSSGRTTPRAQVTTLSPTEFGTRLLARINRRRTNHGCREFRTSSPLVLAAQRHSEAMAARRELSHRLAGEPDLAVRITQAGYTNWRRLAENLAWGQAGPRAVLRAWVASAGHRANLDDCRLRDIGIGVVIRNRRPWVTADFGRRHR